MSGFDVLAVGERRLQAFFDELPARLNARLYAGMERVAARLAAAVEAAEPHRTGKLRGETEPFIHQSETALVAGVIIRGSDHSDFGKDAALEYGSHRMIEVHMRRRAGGLARRYQASSLALSDYYERRTNIGADRYLRDPFARLRGDIISDIEGAVGQSVREP
jgi:hypothetical protein